MSKQAEIDYFQAMLPEERQHAIGKPFSDPNCPNYLAEMGAIMRLLPPPPARIIDIGCGTGWTSLFLARRGYDVTGIDISADMLQAAETSCRGEELDSVRFAAHDFESLPYEAEFDAALFYDALHHAVDEEQAVRGAYRALRPRGICVTSEPGFGHTRNPVSRAHVARFGVTERDMPPSRIIAAGRKAGFQTFDVFPNAYRLSHFVYNQPRFESAPVRRWIHSLKIGLMCAMPILQLRNGGIVCMRKQEAIR